jgi:transposase
MQQDSEIYVGLDTSKLKISVALAEAGRSGEVRFFGDIDSTPEAVARLVAKLEKRHGQLAFCFENNVLNAAAMRPPPGAVTPPPWAE